MKKIIKRIIVVLLVFSFVAGLSACQKQPVLSVNDPQLSEVKEICSLAVLECYYHNVAKFRQEAAETFLFWTKDKHFWVEYSGVAQFAIDASRVSMTVEDTKVTITLPPATVKSCTVDSSSITPKSFIVDQASAKITASDEIMAFSMAQADMWTAVSGDSALLSMAQNQAKELLEEYIKNFGAAVGKDYRIEWILLPVAE